MRRLIISLSFLVLVNGVATAQTASPTGGAQPHHIAPPQNSAQSPDNAQSLHNAQPLDKAKPDGGVPGDDEAQGDDAATAESGAQDVASKVELPLRRPEPPKNIPPAKLAPANDLFGAVATPAPLAVRVATHNDPPRIRLVREMFRDIAEVNHLEPAARNAES